MLKELGKTLKKFQHLDASHTGSFVEASLFEISGMIHLRCQEYGIKLEPNTVKLLGLKGQQKAMFLELTIPFAKCTIAKGRVLTTAEAQKIWQERP